MLPHLTQQNMITTQLVPLTNKRAAAMESTTLKNERDPNTTT